MKKYIISFFVVVGSIAYVLTQHSAVASDSLIAVPVTGQDANTAPSTSGITIVDSIQSAIVQATNTIKSAPKTTPKPVTQTPAPVATPVKKPSSGAYVDGTYTGPAVDAYYGYVQVAAVISGGRLSTVKVLQYPSDRGTSVYINQQALPMLITEAVSAQSANINAVSGASETSPAFIQSLQGALAKAKA